MSEPAKKNNFKNIIIIITLVVIISVLWFFLASSKTSLKSSLDMELSLASSKYESSLKRLEKMLESFDDELFNRASFMMLKSFIKLPLELGRIGKENPFSPPEIPDDLEGGGI